MPRDRSTSYDDDVERKDSRIVEEHPDAKNADDRKTLADHTGYESNMTRTPEETFEAQARRSGRDLNPDAEKRKHVRGSALPEEEGHRG